MTDPPGWLLSLVAAVERYEEEHSKIADGEECFAWPLKAVPAEVRAMARGYAQARRDAAAAVPEEASTMTERIEIDKEELKALFDIATHSMDFGSGFPRQRGGRVAAVGCGHDRRRPDGGDTIAVRVAVPPSLQGVHACARLGREAGRVAAVRVLQPAARRSAPW